MSYFEDVNIKSQDSGSIDAFGRWRTSEPFTIFDSKQLHDNQPLFWDDAETSGSGTSSAHDANEAATTMSVGASTAGTRVRQTFQRFNYQPGKSHQILLTFTEFDTTTGITKRVGYFDGDNGIFLESEEGTINIVRRSKATGSVVDTEVAKASWNIDVMDGTGVSAVNLDFTKTQILIIDFEWLGVGRVRVGFVVDGKIYYAHEFKNANNLTTVYMSTPNLPCRYEIANDGNGAADDFVHICASVQSEGGQDRNGIVLEKESGAVSSLSSGTTYGLLGLRLQSGSLDAVIEIESVSIISTTVNDLFYWQLLLNPTTADGGWSYTNHSAGETQTEVGTSSSTFSGGTSMAGGYGTTSIPQSVSIPNALRLGSKIDGTADEIVLAVTPITNNITMRGSITWRELS